MSKRKIKKIVRIKKNKKHHPFRKFFLIFLIILIFISIMGYKFMSDVSASMNNIQRIDIGQTDEELMINTGIQNRTPGSKITNIALFGVDTRDPEDGSRSDSIMILSVDEKNKSIKLTSILRDTYLKIPGEYYTRINAAYSLGGPKLAVNTINRNFDMDIQDFITLDFRSIAHIVDAMGGLTLTVESYQVKEMNACIAENNALLYGVPSPDVEAGTQLCDGKQVLAYTRMRYLGNGDFDRTARQREVISMIFDKFKSEISPSLILNITNALSEDIVTSLDNADIYRLAFKFLRMKNNLEVSALTDSEFLKAATIDGAMILLPYTLSDAAIYLHKFIYNVEDYSPTETLNELSKNLYNRTYYEKVYTIDTDTTKN